MIRRKPTDPATHMGNSLNPYQLPTTQEASGESPASAVGGLPTFQLATRIAMSTPHGRGER